MDTKQLLIFVALLLAVVVVGVLLWSRRRSRAEPDTVLTGGLGLGASGLGSALRRAWGSGLDASTWDQIEEALLAADIGVGTTDRIVSAVREARPGSVDAARASLAANITAELQDGDRGMNLAGRPAVVLVVGVNGTGKTTTIAKLAKRLTDQGKSVILGAADTFRAAAGEQLKTWGDRVGVDVVSGQEGGDPAAVAFDTIVSGRAKDVDVVIIDTAGRLHGKKNLMSELAKIHRVAAGEAGVDEVLLVLDGTAGQNGLAQVKQFAEAVPVTGLVLTKLDGTAKGGIVITVEKQLGVPVKFAGVGEGLDDLQPFDPVRFVSALLEDS